MNKMYILLLTLISTLGAHGAFGMQQGLPVEATETKTQAAATHEENFAIMSEARLKRYTTRYNLAAYEAGQTIKHISHHGQEMLTSNQHQQEHKQGAAAVELKVWSMESGQLVETIAWQKPINMHAISTNYIVFCDPAYVLLFDRKLQQYRYLCSIDTEREPQERLQSIAITRNQEHVFAETRSGIILCWSKQEDGYWKERIVYQNSDKLNTKMLNPSILAPALYAEADLLAPYEIYNKNFDNTEHMVTVQLNTETSANLLASLSANQQEFIEWLINLKQLRGKNRTITLQQEYHDKFAQLPVFAQTALKINLKLEFCTAKKESFV